MLTLACGWYSDYFFENQAGVSDYNHTRVCAVENHFCMTVKLLSEDGAVVHVACVHKTLSCIFEQQITFSILQRLKELELCIWVGCKGFL